MDLDVAKISVEFDPGDSFSDGFVLIVEAIAEELTVVAEVEIKTVFVSIPVLSETYVDSKFVSPAPEAVAALRFKAAK